MAKFCTNCGRPIEHSAAFCSFCGAPLAETAASQTQPQQAQPPQWQQPQQAQPPQWQQPQQAQPPRWQQPQQTQPPRWQQPQQTQPSQWQQPQQTQPPQWQQPQQTQPPQWQQPTGQWSPPHAQQSRSAPVVAGSGARVGIPVPGWSDRVNDPELLAALAKQKRVSGRIAAFLVPIPLVGFAIYGLASDNLAFPKALLYGAIVSLVFLIFSLIGKRQSSSKNAYEGMVVDKQTRTRRRSNGSSNGSRDYSVYNELITVVRTSTGEQKRIVETDDKRTLAWDYLQVGERFRYHPEHAFPYELYDKSHAPCLYCVVCQKKNPVTEDRCIKCGTPLLK